MGYSFPKEAKLCGAQEIAAFYKSGKRFTSWPLRVTFQEIPEEQTRVLVWAPKSLFKHAVDRNRLRRLMREAYRLNAEPLRTYCSENHCSFQLAFNYMDKELRSQEQISKAMQKAIKRLTELNNK
jgi:ribonuclease P protein component